MTPSTLSPDRPVTVRLIPVMTETSWLEIDLAALDANLAAFTAAMAPGAGICAVVKADGYGLGAVPVARRLASGVRMLGVYNLDEARELAAAGVAVPLLVLMPIGKLDRTDVLYRSAVSGRLHVVVHSHDQLRAVAAIGQTFGSPIPVHLEIDTGMSRGGMSPDEAQRVLHDLPGVGGRYVKLAGIFTHPASAESDIAGTNRQLHTLDQVLKKCRGVMPRDTAIHFANTYAALRDKKYHRSMLRIGLGLYGYGQQQMTGTLATGVAPLRPVVRWMSNVVHVREVPSGTPVGYGSTFTTWRDSRLGIVPAGYADGYPAALTGKGVVRVGDQLTPVDVRGAVNMDQLIIDLTDTPNLGVGATVELYSNDPAAPNALHALAAHARTHCYELLCRLSNRLIRKYVTANRN